MLDDLRREIMEDKKVVTIESYDLEEAINNIEEYYTTMSSLESTIETADLMANILNRYEFKNEDEIDNNEIDTVFNILGISIPSMENDGEQKISLFRKIINFIKEKLRNIWNKIKKLIDRLVKLFKGRDLKTYNPGLAGLLTLCDEHSADLSPVIREDIREVIKKKAKNPEYEYGTIINESYRYAMCSTGPTSILSGDTLKNNYVFGSELLREIAYLINNIKYQLSFLNSDNTDKVLDKLYDIIEDVEIYNYRYGEMLTINNDFDLIPVYEKSVTSNTIEKVYTLDCTYVTFFLKSSIKDIKESFEEYYNKYIKETQKEVNYVLYKLDKELKNIDNIDESPLKIDQRSLYLIKRVILFLIPKLIEIWISNGKYLINPTVETWAEYSYIYLKEELDKIR